MNTSLSAQLKNAENRHCPLFPRNLFAIYKIHRIYFGGMLIDLFVKIN